MTFNDATASWEIYKLLDAFADSLGGWHFMDVLGKPAADLPHDLYEDLVTWRWLVGVARKQKAKRAEEDQED